MLSILSTHNQPNLLSFNNALTFLSESSSRKVDKCIASNIGKKMIVHVMMIQVWGFIISYDDIYITDKKKMQKKNESLMGLSNNLIKCNTVNKN